MTMVIDNSGGADSSKWSSRGDEAEDRAERGRISEDGDATELKSIPSRSISREKMASWVGQPSVKGSTEGIRMALLTLTAMGLQYVALLTLTVLESDKNDADLHGELK